MIGRGQVLRATAGRDRDKYFIVMDDERDGYVLLADGKSRPVSRPKRKNVLHVAVTSLRADDIERLLADGLSPTNKQVKRALARLLLS